MRPTIAVLILVLGACAKAPAAQSSTDNPNFEIERLFTNDGCNVYRFYDAGRYHYYADCGGTTSIIPAGKVNRPEEISNVRPKR